MNAPVRTARPMWRVMLLLAGWVLGAACEPGKGGVDEKEDQAPPTTERAEPVELRADGSDVEYTLGFDDRQTHHVDVQAVFPTNGESDLELFMPVWTPGSYLVREYSRLIVELTASTPKGEALEVDKTRKNRWRVATAGADQIVVRYRLYAREMSVRTNFVDAELAVLNGAPTFLSMVGSGDRAHDVMLEMPDDWNRSVTGLPPHPAGTPHRYVARDYDTLVDSPIVIGNPVVDELEVQGLPHLVATFGGGEVWDHERAARDVRAIVDTQLSFWGSAPYGRYVFLNVLAETGGGLEHANSTLMMGSRWWGRKREDYVRWLGLTSHEFFHTWNVKELKPEPLGPFDYENEVYTRSLWIVEGITSYYDDLLLRRAGLVDEEEYLERLSKVIESVQTTAGRDVQSLEDASFDAWIKYYRPHEASSSMAVSYYRKGAAVAFLLDAAVRRATRGTKSLDDVMRMMRERHAKDGYGPADFQKAVEDVAGESFEEFFEKYVRGTDELDYESALVYYGLRFASVDEGEASADSASAEDGPGGGAPDAGATPDERAPAWLGVETSSTGGRITVARVVRDGPAYRFGINAEDELIALDGYRLPDEGLGARLERYDAGEEVEVLISRRGRLHTLDVSLGEKPRDAWAVEADPGASGAQRARRRAWLAEVEPSTRDPDTGPDVAAGPRPASSGSPSARRGSNATAASLGAEGVSRSASEAEAPP